MKNMEMLFLTKKNGETTAFDALEFLCQVYPEFKFYKLREFSSYYVETQM